MAAQILIVGRVADSRISKPGAHATRSSTNRVVTGVYRRLPSLAAIGLRLTVKCIWLGDPDSARAIAALARQGVTSLPVLLGFGQPLVGAANIVDFCDQLLAQHSPEQHGPSAVATDPDSMLEDFYNQEMLNGDTAEDSGMNDDGDGKHGGKFDAALRHMDDRRSESEQRDHGGRGGGGSGGGHTSRESNLDGYAPAGQFGDDDFEDGGGGSHGSADEDMLMAKLMGGD